MFYGADDSSLFIFYISLVNQGISLLLWLILICIVKYTLVLTYMDNFCFSVSYSRANIALIICYISQYKNK